MCAILNSIVFCKITNRIVQNRDSLNKNRDCLMITIFFFDIFTANSKILMPNFTLSVSLIALCFGIKNTQSNCPFKSNTVFTPTEKIIPHKLGDKNISIKVIQYGSQVSTCCINLHDNEITAVQAARAILEEKGGIIIKIENNAKRYVNFTFKGAVYTFDPNRIFSKKGIELTLKGNGKSSPLAILEVEKFAAHLLQLIPDSISCVIALHNNTDGNYSVKSYEAGGSRHTDAKDVYADNWQDVDDIALTTDENLFTKMSTLGYNSILQDNIKANKDGSLSVYYGELNRRYINIETQFGKTTQYKEMLGKLLFILDEEKKETPTLPATTNSN